MGVFLIEDPCFLKGNNVMLSKIFDMLIGSQIRHWKSFSTKELIIVLSWWLFELIIFPLEYIK